MTYNEDPTDKELPKSWQRVQAAIWLIGLAILFWQGWIWPGILILVAISALTHVGLQFYLSKQTKKMESVQATQTMVAALPETCPTCGAPMNAQSVVWTTPTTAKCNYCNAKINPLAKK